MAEETGADVDLDRVPLKYAGLRYDEIWISEAQERMVLSVPQANIDALLKLAADEEVEATVIGTFTDNKSLTIRYNGTVVGEMDMHFLHHGLPKREKVAQWQPTVDRSSRAAPASSQWSASSIKAALTDPTVASKHWIVRQFDHEVLAGSAVKPLTGPGEGPNDAAVVRPRLDSNRGVVLGCGLAPQLGDVDPYWMTIAAIDEAVRNCVCVGGDPHNMAILDNFCWPSSDDPHSLGALVRTCQACYDAAKAYGLPFISGKDSLNNVFAMSDDDAELVQSVVDERYPGSTDRVREQFERQPNKLGIPYTLLITAMSVIEDVDKCIRSSPRLECGQTASVFYVRPDAESWNDVDLQVQAAQHGHVAALIATGRVLAAHDVSDGGLSTALVEMAIGRGCSLEIGESSALIDEDVRPLAGYLLVLPNDSEAPSSISGVRVDCVARVSRPMNDDESPILTVRNTPNAVESSTVIHLGELRKTWRAPLDW
jgi:phosphoribosylformylglycinamidine synthase